MAEYPAHLERPVVLRHGAQVIIRPIRPEDAHREQAFVRTLSDESRHYRFHKSARELSPAMLQYFTEIDYDRHMAFIALSDEPAPGTQVGVGRYVASDDGQACEFAIAVADGWQGQGVGSALMDSLEAAARAAGQREMTGLVLRDNARMLAFARQRGYELRPAEGSPDCVEVCKTL